MFFIYKLINGKALYITHINDRTKAVFWDSNKVYACRFTKDESAAICKDNILYMREIAEE